ncbi:hypothetical protein T492DRAFT_407518 [Pavlovales sp. CCMP2436]|nr:hypothetical protein T492DRAFT_407518 [Pavlovales sp. CCMP2436]
MGEEAAPSAGSGGWKTPACTVAVCIAILWTGLRQQQQQQQQLQQSGVQRATTALVPGSGALLRAALLPAGAEVAAQPAGRHGGLVDAGPSAGANPAAMPQAVADATPSQGVVRRARGPALLSIRLLTAEEAAQHLAMAAAASRKAGRPRLPSAPADSANASTMREWCESSAPAGKILSCERKPPCALNEAQQSLLNEQDCTARKRYSEWPMCAMRVMFIALACVAVLSLAPVYEQVRPLPRSPQRGRRCVEHCKAGRKAGQHNHAHRRRLGEQIYYDLFMYPPAVSCSV